MTAKLFHNPRCSKSRQALAILKENKIEFEIFEYLKMPLKESELEGLLKKLGLAPINIIRKGESIFKELELSSKDLNIKEWAKIIAQNPILLERPIFENGEKAIVGRPPEDILQII
jgi:arsenate reductase